MRRACASWILFFVTAAAAWPQALTFAATRALRKASTDEVAAQALVAEARAGDVVAVMSLQDRASLDAWLRSEGATVDTPEILKSKVERAQH